MNLIGEFRFDYIIKIYEKKKIDNHIFIIFIFCSINF